MVVGRGALLAATSLAACTTVGRLDNGVGVPNEEQGQPIAVCRDVRQPWDVVWPQFRHLD